MIFGSCFNLNVSEIACLHSGSLPQLGYAKLLGVPRGLWNIRAVESELAIELPGTQQLCGSAPFPLPPPRKPPMKGIGQWIMGKTSANPRHSLLVQTDNTGLGGQMVYLSGKHRLAWLNENLWRWPSPHWGHWEMDHEQDRVVCCLYTSLWCAIFGMPVTRPQEGNCKAGNQNEHLPYQLRLQYLVLFRLPGVGGVK